MNGDWSHKSVQNGIGAENGTEWKDAIWMQVKEKTLVRQEEDQ
jgi:hypothetical protein